MKFSLTLPTLVTWGPFHGNTIGRFKFTRLEIWIKSPNLLRFYLNMLSEKWKKKSNCMTLSTWPCVWKKWFKHNSVQKLIWHKATSLLFTKNSRVEFRPEEDKLSWKLNSVLKDQGQEATSLPCLLFRKHSGVEFTIIKDIQSRSWVEIYKTKALNCDTYLMSL